MPVENFTRRDLLRFFAAAPALGLPGGCGSRPLPPGACVEHPVIDVHCHIFNASDIPVEGFVRYVVLGEDEPQIALPRGGIVTQGILDALIAFLVALLSQDAPLAAKEKERLRQRAPLPPPEETEERKLDALTAALIQFDRLARGARGSSDFIPQGFRARPDHLALMAEFETIAAARLAPRPAGAPLQPAQARTIAQALLGPGDLQRYIAFALLFLDYREALAREYHRLYSQNGCVSLITPSFLDMQKWLPSGAMRSPLRDQVDVMDALQKRMGDEGFHMHSFIGFDPWREFEEGGALALVQRAVRHQGFIGVKLYPPMGFRAWRNEELTEFPERAPDDIQEKLTRALRALYDWCLAEEVPILAHAENSLGPTCGYGQRANPFWWRELMKVRGYENLRINLAHFGSFDEVLRASEPPKRPDCPQDAFRGTAWETIIGETIQYDRRPYLFADLSYLYELVSPKVSPVYRQAIREQLKAWINTYDRDVRHLLYGTDWTMIGQEPEHNNYLSRLDAELALTGLTPSERQNVFWRNAARYLGLGRGRRTRIRIENYCLERGIETGWLKAFDAIA